MSSPEHNQAVRRVIVIEGLVNLAIIIAKGVAGITTGSLALIGDMVHSLADLANNAVAWIVAGVAGSPPDREHPYGHRKFEMLAVFGLATLLSVIAVEIALHAIRRPTVEVAADNATLVLMIGVLITNIGLSTWEHRRARQLNSLLLEADATHTLSDVLTTLLVIVGWQLSARGWAMADTIAAIAVSGFVLYLAWGLFRKALPSLIDTAALDRGLIRRTIEDVAGVVDVGQIRSRQVGEDAFADVVIFLPATYTNERCHTIADEVEAHLAKELGMADVHVHVEPAPT